MTPLSACDQLVFAAIAGSPAVQAHVPAARVLIHDRPLDARGDLSEAFAGQARIWVVPRDSSVNLLATSSSARVVRGYSIGLSGGRMLLADLRDIEWAVVRAVCNLMLGLAPTGVAYSDAMPDPPAYWLGLSPLQLHDARVLASDPELIRADAPEEYQDVCDVEVILEAPHAALRVSS